MQEPQDLPLSTIALVSSIADELYEKLLVDQSFWEEEPTEIQSVLKKLSVDTKVKDDQLFKLYKDNWLPYVCLSLIKDSVVASHKATDIEEYKRPLLNYRSIATGNHACLLRFRRSASSTLKKR
ncbi:hypothetical protein DSO57_1025108 [Entomophthora muscae]|uniref:Uncharacterized protein n=1 Tax=Entomophthora muscae TaxID=34485 RepID=A0ACC2UC97_9FUNG|nr:hypothetical protein DSO57_1025108 [Entomophthora muscae]